MLLRNIVHHPGKLDEKKIQAQFAELDTLYQALDTEFLDEGTEC
jgi:hypothetical protein